MEKARIVMQDGTSFWADTERRELEDGFSLTLSLDKIPEGAEHIDFCPELLTSPACEGGFVMLQTANTNPGTLLCAMKPREDAESAGKSNLMPVLVFSDGKRCVLGIITGMPWACSTVTGVKDNVYYTYERFLGDKRMLDEDLTIEYHILPAGSRWVDFARRYREYKLSHGCRPLRERAAERPELQYCVEAPEVRMRLAWKPVPSPVAEQTPETEPPIHVACTFERAERVLDSMKAAGVEKAEICLVGWNIGGHDGRWMQHFPPEEKLGGEEGLRKLIDHAHALGYQIVGHSNVNDSYSIASMWKREDMCVNPDGTICATDFYWGGGRPYQVCPKHFMDTVERDYPKMAELGFRGVEYVDVLTCVPPRMCWSEEHPSTTNETIASMRNVMRRCRELFGGFSSEGGYDHSMEDVDYVLYAVMGDLDRKENPLWETGIPFWEVVYHGIVLYNPCTETVNWAAKDEKSHLKFMELGGRPSAYYHSRFLRQGWNDWMGAEDLTCGSEEEIRRSAELMGRMYREYAPIWKLQYEFIEDHREVAENVFETEYSDGTVVRVDYNTEKITISEGRDTVC